MSDTRIFNVKPSPQDKRDYTLTTLSLRVEPSVDLRSYDSAVEDQGALGSCVAHAVTSAYENQLKRRYSNEYSELSRLFLYYHARTLEGTVRSDAGVMFLRTALKAGNKYGICKESLWDYTIKEFNNQPSPDCYADASTRRVVNYQTVPSISFMMDTLMALKPIVIGFKVFDSFMSVDSENPIVPIPAVTESSIGGHAVTVVGYSIADQYFIIKNSFGPDWGENGYAFMPFDFVRLYAFDRWTFDIHDPSVCIRSD